LYETPPFNESQLHSIINAHPLEVSIQISKKKEVGSAICTKQGVYFEQKTRQNTNLQRILLQI
jgi:hypothetical protein